MSHSTNVTFAQRCAISVLLSFVLLFLLSPDGYTHQLYGRLDSAMFFTQGHAWSKGMLPYVDFTDSKGPLLFAFYALGAWLSPTTYHGVFWLSLGVYTLIFLEVIGYHHIHSTFLHRNRCEVGHGLTTLVSEALYKHILI